MDDMDDNTSNESAASSASAVLVRDFIDHQGPKFHQAFAAESSFNTATSQYQPKEVLLVFR
jgi:hypothetical protein